jgi:ribonuclease E
VVVKSIREYFTPEVREVMVDDEDAYRIAREFFDQFFSKYRRRVKLYREEQPLFSRFQIEAQIEQTYAREVPLKSGGRVCFDASEALVAIDVNSGRVAQAKDIEEAAFITNLEAAEEIARHLRLRDIGGLIVIDFIDMRSSEHKREVEKTFRNALKKDRAKVDISRISKFGLLELSRQRLKSPLADEVYTTCQYCQGRGRIRTTYSMALTVLRRIQERVVQNNVRLVRGTLSKVVAEYLLNFKRDDLAAIEKRYGLTIVLIGRDDVPVQEYNIEFLKTGTVAADETLEEADMEDIHNEKPWYKRLLPF